MRTGIWVMAVGAGLLLATQAPAQTLTFGGVDPTQVVNVPIDTSSAIAPFPQAQLTNPAPTGIKAFFARFFFPQGTVMSRSGFPSAQNLPSTSFFKPFQIQNAQTSTSQ